MASRRNIHIPVQLQEHIKCVHVSRTGMTRFYELSPAAWAIVDQTRFSGRCNLKKTRDGLLMTDTGCAGIAEVVKNLSKLRRAKLTII